MFDIVFISNRITSTLNAQTLTDREHGDYTEEATFSGAQADSFLKGISWAISTLENAEEAGRVACAKMAKLPKLTGYSGRAFEKLKNEWAFWKGVKVASLTDEE